MCYCVSMIIKATTLTDSFEQYADSVVGVVVHLLYSISASVPSDANCVQSNNSFVVSGIVRYKMHITHKHMQYKWRLRQQRTYIQSECSQAKLFEWCLFFFQHCIVVRCGALIQLRWTIRYMNWKYYMVYDQIGIELQSSLFGCGNWLHEHKKCVSSCCWVYGRLNDIVTFE